MSTRREALSGMAIGGAALVAAGPRALAKGKEPVLSLGPHRPGQRLVKPLPFDPKKLKGLSERLLRSHHDNNYAGAVKNLNKVESELASLDKDAPGFVVGGLKERELLFKNSMILHELYFGNLGGDGKPGGAVAAALIKTYGSLARFEGQMRSTAMSLAGGSGWAALGVDLHTGQLTTWWSGSHTQTLALGAPLLVVDMYEHSYALDHGANASRYVEAFFQNIDWQEVDRRFERAGKAYAALAA